MTFQCYNDPLHGWLKVSKEFLTKLGIAEKISKYSYVRNDYVYLEKGYDAPLFLSTLKSLGEEYELKHNFSNKSSKIRSYMPYKI